MKSDREKIMGERSAELSNWAIENVRKCVDDLSGDIRDLSQCVKDLSKEINSVQVTMGILTERIDNLKNSNIKNRKSVEKLEKNIDDLKDDFSHGKYIREGEKSMWDKYGKQIIIAFFTMIITMAGFNSNDVKKESIESAIIEAVEK